MTLQLTGRATTMDVTTNPNEEGDGNGEDDGEQQGRRIQCKCPFEGALHIEERRQEGARATMEEEEDKKDKDEDGGLGW